MKLALFYFVIMCICAIVWPYYVIEGSLPGFLFWYGLELLAAILLKLRIG